MFRPAGVFMCVVALAGSILCSTSLAKDTTAGSSHFTTVDGHRVHYTDYGNGASAMVLVHGWACDETVWREQVGPLSAQLRVITIDLPGHGESDKPEIKYTMELYARAVDAALRDAHVDSVVLVGHSNGTPAVREFYRMFPRKVRALVIVDGPLRAFVDAASMEKFIAPFRGDGYAQAAGRMIDSITRPIASESLRADIKAVMMRTPQRVAVSEFENTADPELWKPDQINVPVLMILAKQPAWNQEYEQFVRDMVPDLDYQVWENVSHFVMMEKPREFNEAVLAFLSKKGLLPNRS